MKKVNLLFKTTLILILYSVIPGCTSYLKLKYGMTEPKEETPQSLISFLQKNNYPTNDMYMFSDSVSYCSALRNQEFIKQLLGHLIFNRDGSLLSHDTTKCQWSGSDVIWNLNKDSMYLKVPGLVLNQILDHIRPLGIHPVQDSIMTHPDFTVIVTWAKFIGKYNYRLFDLADAVKDNKTSSIRLIWLNVDMQESWHLTKQQRLVVR